MGGGITTSGLSYTGAAGASGTFTGGLASGIGIESGIILTSGRAADAVGPNSNSFDGGGSGDDTSTNNGLGGDADLNVLSAPDTTRDATILEFDFETTGGDLFFNYVFASEEYNDFVTAGFNDVFGFFLDGVNIALIPGTSTPVGVDTVNLGANGGLFNNNTSPATFDIEYDGFTDVFTAQALALAAGTHHIKLAIADTGDRILDSAVFIQAGSFSDTPTPVVPLPSALGTGMMVLGSLGVARLARRKKTA